MAKGSGSVEKDLNIVVSIIKNNSRYNVDAIVQDIGKLQEALTNVKGLVDTVVNLKIVGAASIKDSAKALSNMSRVLGGGSNSLADKITKTFDAINSGISKIGDSTALITLQNNLSNLITAFQSLNLSAIKDKFGSFVKEVESFSKATEAVIKPIDKLTGSFDKLDKKIETSLNSLQRYSELIGFINQAASGAAQNFGGAKVPVFKSKETEVIGLISQYEKLDKSINKSFESIKRFENTPATKIDRGLEKQATSEAKKIERSYLGLTEVISKLSLEYQILSQTQNANSSIMLKLDGIIKGLSAQQQRYNLILDKSKDAARQVENAERARRDAYNEQFNSLKGVIERQIEFVTSAAILAGAAETVRLGFSNILNTLNETGRILTVSRSQFLSLADTAILVGQTINDASVRTGSSVKEIGTILKELGSAGLTTEQSVAALDSTLANIIGTESSVVETTRLVASTFNILGNSVTGTGDQVANFSRINDIFARATNESSLEMDQLVQSLKFSITAATESGLNLEELTGILGQLADQGLRGGNAGRALRASLQQLSKDASLVAKALNIQIDLSKPLDLLDVLKQYSEQIKGQELSVEELGTVFERFGLRGADVFLLLAQNFEKVEGKIKDLTENSQNAAFIAQDLKLDTPERQLAIFQENLARLVKSAIEPFVTGMLALIKIFNRFADTVRLIVESDMGKWILTFALVTASLRGFLNMLLFILPALSFFSSGGLTLVKVFAETAASINTAKGAVATATVAIQGLSAAVSIFVPYLLALSAALLALYYIYERITNASKVMKKEIDETIKLHQKNIAENRNLTKSYEEVAKRITEASDALDKGNISNEEYANELNNISELSDVVANVIAKYGSNAAIAAEELKGLAEQQRQLESASKELIKIELFKKFKLDEKDAVSVGEKLKALDEVIKNLKDRIANGNVITESLIGSDLAIYEKMREKTEKDASELIKSIVNFANTTADASIRSAALATAKALQQILNPGTVAGLGNSVNKFVDIIDIAQIKIKDFNLNKVKTELSEFKSILGDSTQGFEALQRDYAFKFKIIIPDNEIDAIKKTFDNIPAEAITRQANDKIVNSFNFSGLAQIFKTDFEKNLGIPIDLSNFEKQIADVVNFDTNKEQIEALNEVFDKNIKSRIEEIGKIKDQEVAGKKIFDLLQASAKFKSRILDLENDSVFRQNLLSDAGELQIKQETVRNFLIEKNNAALKEARTIRRDIIKADEYEVSLAKQNLDLINKSLKDTRFQKPILNLEETKFQGELLSRQVVATKELAAAGEKLRQDRTRIRRELEESELSLENQKRIGTIIADQSFRELKNIKLRRKFLEEDRKLNINPKIIQTELNKLKEKENEIERTTLISRRDSLLQLTKTRQGFLEFIDINNIRLKQQNEIVASYQELLIIQNDLNNASENKIENENQIYELIKRSSNAQLSILNAARDLSRFETKQYENAEKLLSVREKYNKETEKIFQQNVDNIADPLTKVLTQFFEDGNFSSTLTFVKSIGGGFQDVDKYLGNSNLAAQDFLKFLRQGKIDLSDYPVKLQEIAKAYKTANDELLNSKKIQNEINSQRFAILEKNFSRAISRGGQEGFDRASAIIGNLTELSEVIDPETGRIDRSRSELLLSRVLKLQEELDDYNFEDNVNPLSESLAVAKTNADLLADALRQVGFELKNLNAAGMDALSNNKAFNISINGLTGSSGNGRPVGRSMGGFIPGTGSGDVVPAMLEPGEFVIPKKIVNQKGADFFYNLIGGVPQKGYALGGVVRGYQKGGIVDPGDRIPASDTGFIMIEALSKVNDNLEYLYNLNRAGDIGIIENLEFLYNLTRAYGENLLKPIESYTSNIPSIKNAINDLSGGYSNGDIIDVLKQILASVNEEYNIALNSRNLNNQDQGITKQEVDDLLKFLDESVQATGPAYNTKFLNRGGFISGTGSGDIIPAMLEPGEFVIPKRVVDEKGLEFFYKLISMKPKKFADGGQAGFTNIRATPSNSFFSDLSQRGTIDKESSLNSIIEENNFTMRKLIEVIEKSNKIYEKERSIKLQDVDRDSKTTAMRNSAVDEILASPMPKKQQRSFEELANEYLPLYDELTRVISGLGEKYAAYRKQVVEAGKSTNNFFLKASAKSADIFLSKIENIGNAFKEIFTKELPDLIGFFLNDVIKANSQILMDYNKTKEGINKAYRDQRADLIEQLKRNQISYFDFFDKLEDLQENNREDEIKAEKDKNEAIQNQLSSILTDVSRKIASVAEEMFTSVGNAISGIPALLDPAFRALGELGKSIGSTIGSAFGPVGSEIGGAIGGAVGGLGGFISPIFTAAGQLFSFIGEGFAQLVPIVTDLLLMTEEEFKAFISTIETLPVELAKNIKSLVDRIPRIVEALVNSDVIEKVGIAFAGAISLAFPKISAGFSSIIISVLSSLGPVLVSIFDVLPGIITNMIISSFGTIDLIFDSIAGGLTEVFNSFGTNLKQALTSASDSIREGLKNLFSDPSAIQDQFSEMFFNVLVNSENLIDSESINKVLDKVFKDMIEFIKNIDITEALDNVFTVLIEGGIFVNNIYQFFIDVIENVANKLPELVIVLQKSIVENVGVFVSKFFVFLTKALSTFDFSSTLKDVIGQLTMLIPTLLIQFVTVFIPNLIDSMLEGLKPDDVARFVTGFVNFAYNAIKEYVYGQFVFGPLIESIFGPLIDIFVGPYFQGFIRSTGEIADLINALVFVFKTLSDIISQTINDQLSEMIILFNKITKNENFILFIRKINNAMLDATKILNGLFKKIISSNIDALSNNMVLFTEYLVIIFDLFEKSGALELLIDYLDLLTEVMDELYPVLEPVIDFLLPGLTAALVLLTVTAFLPLLANLVALTIVLTIYVEVMEDIEPLLVRLNPLFVIMADIFERIEPILRVLVFVVLTGLILVLIAINTPLALTIVLIFALAAALALFEVTRPAIEQFGQDLQNLANIIITAGENARNAFEQFITDLINQIPRPAGATNNSGGSGSFPSFPFDPPPGFSTGGIVNGMPGMDKIDAKLTRGEYVIRKNVVDKLGPGFFDYLNNSGNGSSSGIPFTNMGISIGTGLTYTKPKEESKLMEYNANTRDYYLENYLRDNESMRLPGLSFGGQLGYAENSPFVSWMPGMDTMDAGLANGERALRESLAQNSPSNNDNFYTGMMASANLGDLTATQNTSDNMLVQPGSNIDRRNEPTIDSDSAEIKIDIKFDIDMRGSNFTGDNIANDIESKLAERMLDNKSGITRIVKEMIEEAKVK